MSNYQISDANERALALDPSRSFIVQAPAGSGKTSLLVARYLKLLSQVNNPEEILAITFTRKAAFEMRSRIIDTLKNADKKIDSENQHQVTTQNLAKDVLKRDKIKKWEIIQNPNRLRIQTIDSFCHYLVSQAPIFTKITPGLKITQNQEADIYYSKAAQGVLKSLSDPNYTKHLETLLIHLDNDWDRAERLFVTMLKSREQWLPHIVGLKNSTALREKMEEALKEIIQENIERCVKLFPKEAHQELKELLEFSKNNHEDPPPYLTEINLEDQFLITERTSWHGVANFLLTKEFTWRKKVTKDLGFPAASSAKSKEDKELFKLMKTRMEELLNRFGEHENLRSGLENLLLSPLPKYQDRQWEMIDALLELLPLLAAHLKVIFDEKMVTDHAEISMAALSTLGNQDTPSDFALNLDYRLEHLLVDEFQDTSLSHYRLLEKLTTTWQASDNRTIFLVGDPMQSIYRFREAEVGLFLRVQNEGIGSLKLQPITLATNFRSSQNIIDWVNNNFTKILPTVADIGLGGVPFKPSTATYNDQESTVKINLLKDSAPENEAKEITKTVGQILKDHPDDSIAILVKARTHLKSIMANLRLSNIKHQAFELEPLRKNMVIVDLFSLTKALYDLTDRISWLAILRAPWCGLILDDLHKIAHGESKLIWENICNNQELNLSADGKLRINRLKTALEPSIIQKERIGWEELIEQTWLNIGGPATVASEIELEYAEAYFELLDHKLDLEILQKKLDSLYIPPTKNSANVQVMTIHKAKGLEFDHVIIPGTNRPSRFDDHKLMTWFERPKLHRGSSLILAPIAASGEKQDHVYQYLAQVDQKKGFYETGRLLYVAMTRAKKSIRVFSNIKTSKDKYNIQSGSLLEQLKPCFDESWIIENTLETESRESSSETKVEIERLTSNWQSPLPLYSLEHDNEPTFELADEQASILGTIIHHCLSQIADTNMDEWNENKIGDKQSYWLKLLKQFGYLDTEHGLKLINQAITETLKDKRGKWILSKHIGSTNEFPITVTTNGELKNYIIDRTFIDDDGTRWIIDYKTSTPEQQDIKIFLDEKAKEYSEQLSEYAKAMDLYQPIQKLRLGLYFPLFSGWVEIN